MGPERLRSTISMQKKPWTLEEENVDVKGGQVSVETRRRRVD
jgi:hypothetical protein